MLRRLRKWVRIEKALNLVLDHKNPTDHGYTLDEEDAAIDKCLARLSRVTCK